MRSRAASWSLSDHHPKLNIFTFIMSNNPNTEDDNDESKSQPSLPLINNKSTNDHNSSLVPESLPSPWDESCVDNLISETNDVESAIKKEGKYTIEQIQYIKSTSSIYSDFLISKDKSTKIFNNRKYTKGQPDVEKRLLKALLAIKTKNTKHIPDLTLWIVLCIYACIKNGKE